MSYFAKCSAHDLMLRIPETDHDYTLLSNDVDLLLKHVEENPLCKFKKVNENDH